MFREGPDLVRCCRAGRINAVAIIQSGLPWGVSDATTDFAGTSEFTGNTAANQGGQWDLFGKPLDFEAIHNYLGVTPRTTGGPLACHTFQALPMPPASRVFSPWFARNRLAH